MLVKQGQGAISSPTDHATSVRSPRQREAPGPWSRRVRTVSLPSLHLTKHWSRPPTASTPLRSARASGGGSLAGDPARCSPAAARSRARGEPCDCWHRPNDLFSSASLTLPLVLNVLVADGPCDPVSVSVGGKRRRGVPRSHGPSQMGLTGQKVDFRLTPRYPRPDGMFLRGWCSNPRPAAPGGHDRRKASAAGREARGVR